ncbi:MAG: hypothetical protein H0T79_17185, partial [Deltaproteobacteria bacterium]|nr:hypothetical protein [Deltaproteobacteria bacterium]
MTSSSAVSRIVSRARLVLVALACAGRLAVAQPAAAPPLGTIEPVPSPPVPATEPVEEPAEEPTLPPSTPVAEDVLTPTVFDPAACNVERVTTVDSGIPTTWADYEITGELVDPPDVVRALLDPTMQGSHALTASARADIRRAAMSFGYHVVGMPTRVVGGQVHQIVHLAPLHLIRNVTVTIDRPVSWNELVKTFTQPLFEEEIRRRMHLRIGTYLGWAPGTRKCELLAEQTRIEQYLFDEGYFDARATIEEKVARASVRLEVKVDLGEPYQVDVARVKVVKAAGASPLLISEAEIRDVFAHRKCVGSVCFGEPRFTNAQHKSDLKEVAELFQKRGFPAVRVTDDFDATTKTSFDRRARKVRFTLTIDPRRELSVVFEGQHSGIDEAFLLQQLTFNQAGSSDEVETGESAKAIAEALQLRGFFDARVTSTRERFPELDRIVFRIEQGNQRQVRAIQFLGNHALTTDQLEAAIATKEVRLSNRVLGTTVRATSTQLAGDVDRIAALYRRIG